MSQPNSLASPIDRSDHGAWWYGYQEHWCADSNLNGVGYGPNEEPKWPDGITWHCSGWLTKYQSLKTAVMMVRGA